MMTDACDVIVVGSGASGVHAAVPLVEAGLRVTMIDVGHEDLVYEQMIPAASFDDVRRSDSHQHRYFLGDQLEGVDLDGVGAGPQIVPPRAYVLQDSHRLGPKRATDFEPLESFALGGLGRAWGAVAFPFNEAELTQCGLPNAELSHHYDTVARDIGVSGGADDDLRSLRGPLASLQAPLPLDHNAARLLDRYAVVRERSLRLGMHLGRSWLAALSSPLGGREPNPCLDMDFWANHGESVYRPNLTLARLRKCGNFTYRPRWLVSTFSESADGTVQLTAQHVDSREQQTLGARSLVLAAGSLGTTRIVLRSLGAYDQRVPFVCNAHTYIPCLHVRGFGLAHASRCHSLAQLTLMHDPTKDGRHLVQAQMYSYRSLQLFRLFRQTPLAHREGLRILRALAPHLVIWVVQHEDVAGTGKFCVLRQGSAAHQDVLEIGYADSPEALAGRERTQANIVRFTKSLGCWPLQRVQAVNGSSVHYGGQLPMTRDDRPLTTEPSGHLRGTRLVYVADGASFAYLPAKGPTFTLMANARRVGEVVRNRVRATSA
jgi:choline dehydrogenase-like flavoprotein